MNISSVFIRTGLFISRQSGRGYANRARITEGKRRPETGDRRPETGDRKKGSLKSCFSSSCFLPPVSFLLPFSLKYIKKL